MNGTIALLAVNASVAAMFATCYFALALIKRGHRRVYLFGISYLIGMVTPLSELTIHFAGVSTPLLILSPIALLAAFLVMSAALCFFEGRSPWWGAIATIGIGGVIVRILILGGQRDDLAYEFLYQLPLVGALALCAGVTGYHAGGRPLHLFLSGLFAVIAFDFLLKPILAAVLGSGGSAQDYADSAYAVFSQASTGVLLIAAGLVVLLLVIQTTIRDYSQRSETDHLSGLLNRRGFDRIGQQMVDRAEQGCPGLTAIMIDVDHFKQINDAYGHDAGDEVIIAFAEVVQRAVPANALIGRTGGDEFAVLLERSSLVGGQLVAATIREQLRLRQANQISITLSQGVAEYRHGDRLSGLMKRADAAAYRAKKEGRDRVACDLEDVEATLMGNVVHMRGAG